jgi:hypothetical protein
MFDRFCVKALLLASLALPLAGCSNNGLSFIKLAPTSAAITVGQSVQFTASGYYGNAKKLTNQDITDTATWAYSTTALEPCNVAMGTTTATPGCFTAIAPGVVTIGASAPGFGGTVGATATVTVTAVAGTTGTGTGGTANPLLSINVMPTSTTVDDLLGTGQYLAYGNFSTAPYIQDITNGFRHVGFPAACVDASLPASTCPLVTVNWISTAQEVFPINTSGAAGSTGGLVTADGSGTDDIYVTAENPDKSVVLSNTVTFNCPYAPYVPAVPATGTAAAVAAVQGTCNYETVANGLLVTLTVYNTGLNTSNWLITAPSATGTPNVISCGPSSATGSVCMATYPVGTTVTLKETSPTGSFGGWSWNCGIDANGNYTPNLTSTCTITLGTPNAANPTSNVSVGAIFN